MHIIFWYKKKINVRGNKQILELFVCCRFNGYEHIHFFLSRNTFEKKTLTNLQNVIADKHNLWYYHSTTNAYFLSTSFFFLLFAFYFHYVFQKLGWFRSDFAFHSPLFGTFVCYFTWKRVKCICVLASVCVCKIAVMSFDTATFASVVYISVLATQLWYANERTNERNFVCKSNFLMLLYLQCISTHSSKNNGEEKKKYAKMINMILFSLVVLFFVFTIPLAFFSFSQNSFN